MGSPTTTLPIPPQELRDQLSGPGTESDYFDVINFYTKIFVEAGRVRPTDRVLEVGSGIGRMAHAMANILTPPGRYDGIEIAPDGLKWCVEHITPLLPHFRFHHADLYNSMYNPAGRYRPRVYRFPFADGTFDFVFLTSVFTHLLPRDTAHYLDEVARVLKPGGRLFGTFFLFNEAWVKLARSAPGLFHQLLRYGKPPFLGTTPDYGDCFVADLGHPEAAVGYEQAWVGDQIRECGLTPDPGPYYYFSGVPTMSDGQGVVCGTKTGRPSLARRLRKALRMDGVREWVWRWRMGRSR